MTLFQIKSHDEVLRARALNCEFLRDTIQLITDRLDILKFKIKSLNGYIAR